MRRRSIAALLCSFLAFPFALAAGEGAAFTLSDPKGDDHGDGTLVYPLRDDMGPGDLDLVSFAAKPVDGGTEFTATFAKPVRQPDVRAIDSLGTRLDQVAKLGFYTFNIDVYVDTDRRATSGSTESLPGRRVAIDPRTAWEKVVCLTPRPLETRDVLRAILARRAKDRVRAEARQEEAETGKHRHTDIDSKKVDMSPIERDIDGHYFFPTRVRVAGRAVTFFVPDGFLGGAASPNWAYVVAVTGSDLSNKLDVGELLSGAKDPAKIALSNIMVGAGKSVERFGSSRDADDLPSPVVDVIVPAGQKQEDVLADYDPNKGKLATLTGVVPAEQH